MRYYKLCFKVKIYARFPLVIFFIIIPFVMFVKYVFYAPGFFLFTERTYFIQTGVRS